jgi:hypothetical protein
MNQIEKLIQIVVIEQLHGMIKNMNIQDSVPVSVSPPAAPQCQPQNKEIEQTLSNIYLCLKGIEKNVLNIVDRITVLESSMPPVQSQSHSNVIDNGQTKLTQYAGFSDEQHVILKVEEKVNDEVQIVEKIKPKEVIELKEEENEEEVESEEESEEEVDTEEEIEAEVVAVGSKMEVEEEEVEEEEAEEEEAEEEEAEEEDEEVFEIEIDDVTYYATGEENGVLYEVDKGGDVGKKVGIIKDGEPIFS